MSTRTVVDTIEVRISLLGSRVSRSIHSTLGPLSLVVVTVASVVDAQAAKLVFEQLKPAYQPRLTTVWADSKYHNHDLNAWLKRQRSIKRALEIIRKPIGVKGFVLLPKRWVVERTFSWITR